MTSFSPHRPRTARRLAAALAALLLPVAAGAQIIPACPVPVDPIPAGALGRPVAAFPGADHHYLHSSDHLQGRPANVKWAGGLIYRPPVASGFDQFTSAVVVDNPNPAQPLQVQIDYFDHNGVLVGTSFPAPIPPEGHYVEAAAPLAGSLGVGSARITAIDGHLLVGSSLLHTPCVTNSQGLLICDNDVPQPTPGASSLQQLQVDQGSKELWWGPLPLTMISNIDFFNLQSPFLWVVNPNNQINKIRVDLVAYERISGAVTPFTWRNYTLQPFGTLLEKAGPHLAGLPVNGLWDQFYAWYAALPQPYDYDVMVHIVSESSLPILGDGVMTDFYGTPDATQPDVLLPGDKFRMASHMLASTPTQRLIDPDFSYQPGGVIQTLIGLFNAGTVNAGPIRIQYFNNNGVVVGTGNIPVLPPNQSVRIEPGTFGYPAGAVGFGWVRIDGCSNDKLVGWSVREIQPTGTPHYHKAFGELLDGNGGKEPGDGFTVTNATGTWIRKVSTIVRTWPSWYWPGYTTFANTNAPNVGLYWDLFFNAAGGACTNVAGQPFAGVPFARTSTTYEDPQSICGPANLSGRVDTGSGRIKGIHVLGDPFVEWGIPGFADGGIEP